MAINQPSDPFMFSSFSIEARDSLHEYDEARRSSSQTNATRITRGIEEESVSDLTRHQDHSQEIDQKQREREEEDDNTSNDSFYINQAEQFKISNDNNLKNTTWNPSSFQQSFIGSVSGLAAEHIGMGPIRENSCDFCGDYFDEGEEKISFGGRHWHRDCFLCCQCFQPLQNDQIFQVDGRAYCRYDYEQLYAPKCSGCQNFISNGRVIKALHKHWHPECFVCAMCSESMADKGNFKKINNIAYCPKCFETAKHEHNGGNARLHKCMKCQSEIEQHEQLFFQGKYYHAYHYRCSQCGLELNNQAKEKGELLWCVHCFDQLGIPICAACRRPIEDRVVRALGKAWHVNHFVCGFCNKPFLGSAYKEHNGFAYCTQHYRRVVKAICHRCSMEIQGNAVTFRNKDFCENHFQCTCCDRILDQKSKIYQIDLKPICKICMERMPTPYRKRLAALHKS